MHSCELNSAMRIVAALQQLRGVELVQRKENSAHLGGNLPIHRRHVDWLTEICSAVPQQSNQFHHFTAQNSARMQLSAG